MTALQVLQVHQSSLAQHWARDWRALALTQVNHQRQPSVVKKKVSFLSFREFIERNHMKKTEYPFSYTPTHMSERSSLNCEVLTLSPPRSPARH